MALGSPALTGLAQDWRKLLFPQADDAQFADGYAQAVTFGLLIARARDISLSGGTEMAAQELSHIKAIEAEMAQSALLLRQKGAAGSHITPTSYLRQTRAPFPSPAFCTTFVLARGAITSGDNLRAPVGSRSDEP